MKHRVSARMLPLADFKFFKEVDFVRVPLLKEELTRRKELMHSAEQ